MTEIQILLPYEAQQFDKPPTFNQIERQHFFKINQTLQTKIEKAKTNTNKIGLVIQYGYFKASGKFYIPSKYKKRDIIYVANMLTIDIYGKPSKHYKPRTRCNHKIFILKSQGNTKFSSNRNLFEDIIGELVSRQIHPRKIIFSTVDLLRSRKIEIPNYDTFAKSVTAKLNSFEHDLTCRIEHIIEPVHIKALDGLIETEGELYQRPILTRLKYINQSVKPGKIKQNIHGFLIIKKLYYELRDVINELNLSPEALHYYAEWTIKAKISQISAIAEDSRRFLYLLSFISHQFKMWQDTFMDVLLKCTQQQLNKVKTLVDEINSSNFNRKNELADTVIKGFTRQKTDINKVKSIVYNKIYSSEEKIQKLQEIIPEKDTAEDQKLDKLFREFETQLDDDKNHVHYYSALQSISRKLQNRVSDVIRYLDFEINPNEAELSNALNYYQTHHDITKSSPGDFLNDDESKMVYKDGKFNVSMYKAILFDRVAEAVKSGSISLTDSYRYMAIESYLIDKNLWENDKENILKKTELTEFLDITKLLSELKLNLDKSFFAVNERIVNKTNKYVKIKNTGRITVHTPPLEKPDYDSFTEMMGSDKYVPILQMMSEVNDLTHFTSSFKHHKVKGSHTVPSNEVYYAGIFSLGSNIGMQKLANTAIGVKHNTLSNAVNWYFSLENLHSVNDMITNFINELWLPGQFKKEKDFLHTSSDGQKRNVSAESLNSNFSYKYFGHGKGSNIYTFIDERGILFYSTVFSSSERDAAYVIDGLLHNPSFKSDMHSTDTEGYTDTIFAVSHLIKTTFAPRIKDIASVSLLSFDKIKGRLEQKEYPVKPDRYVNTKLIINNWDTILRLLATVKLREHKASTILKRLNSYDKQHPLQSALKEFGRIIKSVFILKYIDDAGLRQTIEKQLNKGELANKFSSAVSFANNHEIVQIDKTDQEIAAMCKTVIQNVIILWNYIELTKLIMRSDLKQQKGILVNIANASIIAWKHVNLLGTYDFSNLKHMYNEKEEVEQLINFKAA